MTIRSGNQTRTAADLLPAELHDVVATITRGAAAPSDCGCSG
ncbi:hypothetical protein [Mycobacterium tuberculosis]